MSVKLRIVGLYFNKDVVVPSLSATTTIKDVMDAYRATAGDINVPGGMVYFTQQDDPKTSDDDSKSLFAVAYHVDPTVDTRLRNSNFTWPWASGVGTLSVSHH